MPYAAELSFKIEGERERVSQRETEGVHHSPSLDIREFFKLKQKDTY